MAVHSVKVVKLESTKEGHDKVSKFLSEAGQVILGKDKELKLALVSLFARGHILMEDLPGMGKTTFVMVLAQLTGLKMSRVQFTNDLLPADVIGANIYDAKTSEFRFFQGPIFAEVVLGDELNRASAKSQSAFLQAMEERQVTVEGKTHQLPEPFFIIATQNPQSQVGTNPLPESQLDRFLIRLKLGYPDRASEHEMLAKGNPRDRLASLKPIISREEILEIQKLVDAIVTGKPLIEYVQDLLLHARQAGYALSPRAGILILQAAKALAYVEGRDMVLPEDVQYLAPFVWSHRVPSLTEEDMSQLIQRVRVP